MGIDETNLRFTFTAGAVFAFFGGIIIVSVALIQATDFYKALGLFITDIVLLICLIVSVTKLDEYKKESVKEKQREGIKKELDMYQDIVNGDPWGWFPRRPGVNDSRYLEYIKYETKFFDYQHRVDPEIQEDYSWLIKKIRSGFKENERDEVTSKYLKTIVPFAENKIIELKSKKIEGNTTNSKGNKKRTSTSKILFLLFWVFISFIGGMFIQDLAQETFVDRITDPIRKSDIYKKINPPPIPNAVIHSPIDGETFTRGQYIEFDGEVTRGTYPFTYIWTSNISGQLSTSRYFTTNRIVSGSHLINFSVNDSNGLFGFDQKALLVEPLKAGLKIEPDQYPRKLSSGKYRIRVDVTNNETETLDNLFIDYWMPNHMNISKRAYFRSKSLWPKEHGYFEFDVEGLNTSCNFVDKITIKFYRDKQGKEYMQSVHPLTKVCMFTTLEINISSGDYLIPYTTMYPFSEGFMEFEVRPSEVDNNVMPYDEALNKTELEYLPNKDITFTMYDFSTPCLRGDFELDWCQENGFL